MFLQNTSYFFRKMLTDRHIAYSMSPFGKSALNVNHASANSNVGGRQVLEEECVV